MRNIKNCKSTMKNKIIIVIFLISSFLPSQLFGSETNEHLNMESNFFEASNNKFNYFGRFDFSSPSLPRVWAAGAYLTANFSGTYCEIVINDEIRYGSHHNYIYINIDDTLHLRKRLEKNENKIIIWQELADTEHTITICKDTEGQIGYIEFVGIYCKKLLPPSSKPKVKIEFIGDSITSGASMYSDEIPCGTRDWHDQHNAYNTYGAVLSRNLNAQYRLSSKSGIGLIRSCCDIEFLMPEVYSTYIFEPDSLIYNVKSYQPDIVSICLGQNDGVQDSIKFCNAYVEFIETLRGYYPKAKIVCLTSPMGDENLTRVLKSYIDGIIAELNERGENKLYKYYFKKSYNNGCDYHPDVNDHKSIADELEPFFTQLLKN